MVKVSVKGVIVQALVSFYSDHSAIRSSFGLLLNEKYSYVIGIMPDVR